MVVTWCGFEHVCQGWVQAKVACKTKVDKLMQRASEQAVLHPASRREATNSHMRGENASWNPWGATLHTRVSACVVKKTHNTWSASTSVLLSNQEVYVTLLPCVT